MSNLKNINKPTQKQQQELFKKRFGTANPPKSVVYICDKPSPVEAVAEFAEMGGVLIAYPGTVAQPSDHIQLPPTGPRRFGIPNELIIRMQQANTDNPVHIFIMCADLSQKKLIEKSLSETATELSLTFDPELIHLIPWDTDTYWTRDFGPWWVKNKVTGYYGIAKHTYTTLGGGSVGLVEGAEDIPPHEGSGIFRPNDDYGAVKLSDYLNKPIRKWGKAFWSGHKKNKPIKVHNWFDLGLLEVGGNYMVNGNGSLASSYLVAKQNELPIENERELTHPSPEDFKKRMEYVLSQFNRFMGINKYHVLSDPSGTYIGHIDCWGKYLAEDKVLIATAEDKKTAKAFDTIADSFKEQNFKVYRILCQDIYVPIAGTPGTTAAYTNSLILNDYVYVPMSGKGYEKYDEAALKVYKEALPSHNVIGIPSKPETPWLGTDAMHCRTRGIPREVINNWLKSQLLL